MEDGNKEILFTRTDVIVPGDKLNWFVNVDGYTTSRIEVTTTFEGDAVTFSAVFTTLPIRVELHVIRRSNYPGKEYNTSNPEIRLYNGLKEHAVTNCLHEKTNSLVHPS